MDTKMSMTSHDTIWSNWADHPVVVVLVALASMATIATFAGAIATKWRTSAPSELGVHVKRTPPAMGDAGACGVVRAGFNEPLAHDTVDQYADVSYFVTPEPAAPCKVMLVVRDPLGQFWSWGTTRGSDSRRIQIGSSSDAGASFQIGLLITKANVPYGQPLSQRPPGVLYRTISVVRR